MDTLSKKRRSWNMSRIKSKNTKPELLVRAILHRAGYRFRLHVRDLPGRPDIVLPKWKTVIFVNGCFWHRHEGCPFAYNPKSRKNFWRKKFHENVRRDVAKVQLLKTSGWKVHTVWECDLADPDGLEKRFECIRTRASKRSRSKQ
jgi:DNA mismatch endonuclease (patch repair protein)